MKIDSMSPRSGRVMMESDEVVNVIDRGQPSIDIIHERIHRKQYYDAQKVYLAVANSGYLRFNVVATTKDAHIVVTVDAEGKARLKSFVDCTMSDPGAMLATFNRYIDGAPVNTTVAYESPTVSVQGSQRFDKLILGGTGPQSTGTSSGSRIETIISKGHSVCVEIQNVSGQAKDFGVMFEWYEI